jgi:hypothetical protein
MTERNKRIIEALHSFTGKLLNDPAALRAYIADMGRYLVR